MKTMSGPVKSAPSTEGPASAGPSQDMAQRFAVLRALGDAAGEAAPVDASTRAPGQGADEPRYEFAEVFASGGLGTIRRAYDRRLERHVAVKELQSFVPGGASEARFQREALLTARLEHPSIVPIQDRGVHPDGSPYFCMKLIDGQSLDALVRARPHVGDRLALVPHVLAVADALAYAHARGVIHRDLKPANILVGPFGETLVIDWGLAKDLLAGDSVADERSAPVRSDAPSDDLTRTGEFVGTLPFMPLEQAEGRDTDARADVYAIGAILYFVLSGCLPYEGRPALPMLTAMLAGPPVDLATRIPGLPADLLAIVRKAMARKPADRYPSAQELAADLRRLQAGRMVEARPYSPIDVLRHFGRRHRAVVGVASVGLVMLAGLGTYSYTQVLAQRSAAEAQRAEAVAAHATADERRGESEAQARAARASAARLLTENGRRELFVRHRPQQALVLLAGAARLAGDDVGTRTMLAEATRAVDARRMTLPGHTDGVVALAHSPSGRRLLARSRAGEVRVWDLERGEQLARLTVTDDAYTDAMFVADDEDTLLTMTRRGELARHRVDGERLTRTTVDRSARFGGSFVASSLGGDSALVLEAAGIRRVDLATGAVKPGPSLPGPTPYMSFALATKPGAYALTEGHLESQDYSGLHFRVIRWDLAGDGVQASPELLRNFQEPIVASPDGRRVAFVDAAQVHTLWDAEAQKLVPLDSCGPFAAPDGHPQQAAGFDAAGASLVRLVGADQVARWDLATGDCARVSAPLGSAARGLHVTPDGKQLLLTHEDAEVSLLDLESLALRQRFLAHTRPIGALAVAPDSATMATGSEDGEVRVWALGDPRVLHRVDIKHAATGATDDGRVFALGRRHDGVTAELSFMDMMADDVVEPRGTRTLSRIDLEPAPGAPPAITSLDEATEMSHLEVERGSLLFGSSARSQMLGLWSIDAPGRRGAIEFGADRPGKLTGRLLAASPERDKAWVNVWADDNRRLLQRYSLPDFTLEHSLEIPGPDVISPATRRAVVFGGSGLPFDTARVYDTESGALVATLPAAFGNFSPAGDRLLTASTDGAIRVYDPVSAGLVATLRAPTSQRITTVMSGTAVAVYSRDESVFATSRIDGTIDLWRADSLEWIRELHGHLAPARQFEFSADGKRLLSHRWQPAGGDTITYLWQLDGAASSGVRLDVADLYGARFSPDGRLLATGSSDGVVRLWDGASGKLTAELRGHKKPVTILEFAPSGERLLSAADDDAAITWQVPVERRSQAEIDALIAAQVPFALVDGEVVRR